MSNELYKVFSESNFVPLKGFRNIFLTNESHNYSGLFQPHFRSKRGAIRIGGLVGVFFRQFEIEYKISQDNYVTTYVSPFGCLIDNIPTFLELDLDRALNGDEISLAVDQVYAICCKLPVDFSQILGMWESGNMLGVKLENVVQLQAFHSQDSEYIAKSIALMRWLNEKKGMNKEFLLSVMNTYQRDMLQTKL